MSAGTLEQNLVSQPVATETLLVPAAENPAEGASAVGMLVSPAEESEGSTLQTGLAQQLEGTVEESPGAFHLPPSSLPASVCPHSRLLRVPTGLSLC